MVEQREKKKSRSIKILLSQARLRVNRPNDARASITIYRESPWIFFLLLLVVRACARAIKKMIARLREGNGI